MRQTIIVRPWDSVSDWRDSCRLCPAMHWRFVVVLFEQLFETCSSAIFIFKNIKIISSLVLVNSKTTFESSAANIRNFRNISCCVTTESCTVMMDPCSTSHKGIQTVWQLYRYSYDLVVKKGTDYFLTASSRDEFFGTSECDTISTLKPVWRTNKLASAGCKLIFKVD